MEFSSHFIIIDDGVVDTFITKEVIKRNFKEATIKVFVEAKAGLEFIKSEYSKPGAIDTILFLDLDMPVMSGWDFLENFENFDDAIKSLFKIYVLSSSTHKSDIARALSYKDVTDYIIKPLSEKDFLSLGIVNAFELKHNNPA